MALKDIQIPKAEVQVAKGSSFAVRGLSTSDIEHLIRQHGADLRSLFAEFMKGGFDNLTKGDMAPLLRELIGRVPGLAIDTIALAADADDEDRKVIKKLPAGVQVDALVKTASLTLDTEGDLGNVQGALLQALQFANQGMAEMAQAKAAS